MKYLTLPICLFLSLSLFGQNDIYTTELFTRDDDEKGKHVLGIDFSYLCIAYHHGWRISKKNDLFLGVEAGCGPNAFYRTVYAGKYFTEEHTIWSNDRSFENDNRMAQLLFAHLFLRWESKKKWIEGDLGFRAAYHWRSLKYYDGIADGIFLGPYLNPAFGFKRLKIGIRLDAGIMHANNPVDNSFSGYYDFGKFNEFVVIASPFIRYSIR